MFTTKLVHSTRFFLVIILFFTLFKVEGQNTNIGFSNPINDEACYKGVVVLPDIYIFEQDSVKAFGGSDFSFYSFQLDLSSTANFELVSIGSVYTTNGGGNTDFAIGNNDVSISSSSLNISLEKTGNSNQDTIVISGLRIKHVGNNSSASVELKRGETSTGLEFEVEGENNNATPTPTGTSWSHVFANITVGDILDPSYVLAGAGHYKMCPLTTTTIDPIVYSEIDPCAIRGGGLENNEEVYIRYKLSDGYKFTSTLPSVSTGSGLQYTGRTLQNDSNTIRLEFEVSSMETMSSTNNSIVISGLEVKNTDSSQTTANITRIASSSDLELYNKSTIYDNFEFATFSLYHNPIEIINVTGGTGFCSGSPDQNIFIGYPTGGVFNVPLNKNGDSISGVDTTVQSALWFWSDSVRFNSTQLNETTVFGVAPDSNSFIFNYSVTDTNGCFFERQFSDSIWMYGMQNISDTAGEYFRVDTAIKYGLRADTAAYNLFYGLENTFMIKDTSTFITKDAEGQDVPIGYFSGIGAEVEENYFFPNTAYTLYGGEGIYPVFYNLPQTGGKCDITFSDWIRVTRPLYDSEEHSQWYDLDYPTDELQLCVNSDTIAIHFRSLLSVRSTNPFPPRIVTSTTPTLTPIRPAPVSPVDNGPSSLSESVDRILDKGVLIDDALVRVNLVGLEFLGFLDSTVTYYDVTSVEYTGAESMVMYLYDSTELSVDSLDVHPYMDTTLGTYDPLGFYYKDTVINEITQAPIHNGLKYKFSPKELSDTINELEFTINYDTYTYIINDGMFTTMKDSVLINSHSTKIIINLNKIPDSSILQLSEFYCDNDLNVISPRMQGSNPSFDVLQIADSTEVLGSENKLISNNVYSFSPDTLVAGVYKVTGTTSFAGSSCYTNGSDTIVIKRAPHNNLILDSVHCQDQSFQISLDTVYVGALYDWNLDDQKIDVVAEPTVLYTKNGVKQVSLTTTLVDPNISCTVRFDTTITVGKQADPFASYGGVCADDDTKLFNLSTMNSPLEFDSIKKTAWYYNNNLIGTDSIMYYSFDDKLNPVRMIVTSAKGCVDSIDIVVVNIIDTTIVNGVPLVEDFETGGGTWVSSSDFSLGHNSSWELTTPTTGKLTDGTNLWVTGNDTAYNNHEESWVLSPCMTLDNINKPTFYFDGRSDTQTDIDGAVLQYAIMDPNLVFDSLVWVTVGDDLGGVNWYNSKSILSKPGNQDANLFGWTGYSDTLPGLFESISRLDDVQNNVGSNKIAFRFAFKSDAANPSFRNFEGFAFDNIVITERNKVVLVEHFTNTEANFQMTKDVNAYTKPKIQNLDLVALNYYSNYPYADEFYDLNRADLSSIRLFYKVDQPPYTIIDGAYHNYLDPFAPSFDDPYWGDNVMKTESLFRSAFNMTNTSSSSSVDRTNISTSIEYISHEGFDKEFILRTVIYADSLLSSFGTYEYNVVVDMLPSVAGQRIDTTWSLGTNLNLNYDWTTAVNLPSNTNYYVVSYLQEVETNLIHQVSEPYLLSDYPAPSQGSKFSSTGFDGNSPINVLIYPNPFEDKVVIQSHSEEEVNITNVSLYDEAGRLVMMKKGSSTSIVLETANLPKGAFFVKVDFENGLQKKKLLVK